MNLVVAIGSSIEDVVIILEVYLVEVVRFTQNEDIESLFVSVY